MLHLLVTWLLLLKLRVKTFSRKRTRAIIWVLRSPCNLVAVSRFLRDQLGLTCSLASPRGYARSPGDGPTSSLDDARPAFAIEGRLSNENPEVDSVVSVWPTANWLERETYDMYGIRFSGHPSRRMLLDDDFEGYPLLKSFHQVPQTVKPRATTQVDPNMAVDTQFQQQQCRACRAEEAWTGPEERLHPGTPTFGHAFEDYQKEANLNTVAHEGESALFPIPINRIKHRNSIVEAGSYVSVI